jgi:hypothetical protein
MNNAEQGLRLEIARLSNERDELKQLVKDAMRLAERCALMCEDLKAELEHARAVAKHRLSVLADRGLALNKIDPCLDMQLCNQYPLDPNMWIYIGNDSVDANANNQDFRTTDMG